MNRLFARTALIVAVFVVSFVTVDSASADHFDYRAEDSSLTNSSGYRQFQAMDRWVRSTLDLRWKADSGVRSNVITALSNWESDVPNLGWTENTSTPDVTFEWETGQDLCSFQIGRVYITGWATDTGREAQYISDMGVCIAETPDPNVWSTNGVVQVLAHEIGHVYGLHERYTDQGGTASCVTETTIMDTWTVVNGNEVRHCDNISDPQGIDVVRVNNFWGEGYMEGLDLFAGASNVSVEWDDFGWGDYQHELNYFYHNGSDWIEYDEDDVTDFIGLHQDHPEYESAISGIVSGAPVHGSGESHIACGHPWFAQYDRHGTWMCSNQMQSP